MQLRIWKGKPEIEHVKIMSYCDCMQCREVDGRIITVKEALERMPLPVKNCQKGNAIMGTYSLHGLVPPPRTGINSGPLGYRE